jgi:hypothetical protein
MVITQYLSCVNSVADFGGFAAEKGQIHFLSRRVRGKKFFSACKCASAASAQQQAAKNSKISLLIFEG